MANDAAIKRSVEEELRWDPGVDDATLAVSVKNHVVTLTGYVHRLVDKVHAEQAAKRVAGVAALANDIVVRADGAPRPDPEIAQEALTVLRAAVPLAADALRVVVEYGIVRLEGAVAWHYQRAMAETAVRNVRGVREVVNAITLRPVAATGEVKRQIQAAFHRSATIDASRLTVAAEGNKVSLSGTVRSWAERADAERAAWSAPGVTQVDNLIAVDVGMAA